MIEELFDYHHGTPSAESTRMGIWITSGGHITSRLHDMNKRRIPEGLLQYCIQGSGLLRFKNYEIKIEAGDVFVNFPDIPHTFECNPDIGWQLKYFHYGGPYASELIKMIGFTHKTPVIKIGIHSEIIDLLDKLLIIMKKKQPMYQLDAAVSTISILVGLRKIVGNVHFQHKDIVGLMNYKIQTLDEAVKISGYSKFHFIRLFKKSTGVSPWEHIVHLKIDKAKELLSHQEYTIKQVSNEVGFEDAFYFSRLFKKITGLSPSAFKESL